MPFPEYQKPLLRHLCTVTIYHWDLKTRELAARALRGLAPLAPDYVISDLLPSIVASTTSPFLAVRHGAITSAGVVVEVLGSRLQKDKRLSEVILSVPTNIPEKYTQDFGALLTLSSIASYIGCLSRAGWDIDRSEDSGGTGIRQRQFFESFVQALTVCKEVQGIVLDFTAFVRKYGLSDEQHSIMERYTRVERSGTSCQSYVLAMGALRNQSDFDLLCNLITQGTTVEIRRNAAAALGQFCQRWTQDVGGGVGGCDTRTLKNELAATEALMAGLLDYSVDNRGDVGSWVRKRCLETLLVLYGSDRILATRMAADVVILLLGRTLRAATEKLDRLRERAGQLLEIILYFQQDFATSTTTKATTGAVADPPQQHLQKCLAQLRKCIPPPADFSANSDLRYFGGLSIVDDVYQCFEGEKVGGQPGRRNSGGVNWADPEAAFVQVACALSVEEQRLRQPLFEGLVVTGSAEPLGKFAVKAVALHADALSPTSEDVSATRDSSKDAAATAPVGNEAKEKEEESKVEQGDFHTDKWSVDGIVGELTRLLLTDRRTSKVINPALIVADQLIEQGALVSASGKALLSLYQAVRRVAYGLRAPLRLGLCLKLYGSLSLVSDEMARMALESIRQLAADQTFAMICINGVLVDSNEERMERIQVILVETEWMAAKEEDFKQRKTEMAELVKQALDADTTQ
ncbi:hypothetical protein IWW48_000985 [Coemansia sp. RSA 1200]|nr:hypothetical protein IWW48_000985 [Coemansia sp. RSA 1200]